MRPVPQDLWPQHGLRNAAHHGIVRSEHHRMRILEQAELFSALLMVIREAVAMGRTDVGEHTDRGPDHRAQTIHLAGGADARFEEAERVRGAHLQHAQGHADLAVPAARAADDKFLGTQHLPEPFFHYRFPIATGDADDGKVEMRTVPCRETLQGQQRVRDHDQVGPRECGRPPLFHHEGP